MLQRLQIFGWEYRAAAAAGAAAAGAAAAAAGGWGSGSSRGARAGSRRARACYVQILFRANPAFTQCAPCFEQIEHVELEPCLVVCTWCFAQTGLTFHKCVDFTLNARAHVVG